MVACGASICRELSVPGIASRDQVLSRCQQDQHSWIRVMHYATEADFFPFACRVSLPRWPLHCLIEAIDGYALGLFLAILGPTP